MRSITDLLRQYANLAPPNKSIRSAVSNALKSVCGLDISIKDITYNRGLIQLNVSPPVRSTVFMHKNRIIDAVNKELGSLRVNDVR